MRLGLVAIALLLVVGAPAGDAAEPVAVERAMAERILGSKDAPLTIFEYSSLTCPYCAAFHNETLPEIKKDYIDTGKVRLVYHDFPLDGLAMAAAMVARCAAPDRYFGFLEVLFRSQSAWAASRSPRRELERIAQFGGLSKSDFDACLDNEPLLRAIQARAAEIERTVGVTSTPTFVVNGRKITGATPLPEFRRVIEQALDVKAKGG